MARIVIEEPCEHGQDHSHFTAWKLGAPTGVCPGGSRRVLDPGSFECVDNVDEKWLYLVTEEVHQALAGGEQP